MSSLKWSDSQKTLSQPILDVVKKLNFTKMTPVQAATIPQFISHRDVSVEAVTGSGKTLAFIIPILEILLRRHKQIPWTQKEIGAIIISPTRELADQTSTVLSEFLQHDDLKIFNQKLLVGGSSTDDDVAFLRQNSVNIIICTPGRLEELLERKGDNLAGRVKSLEVLVLDEADRLLDLGFKNSINTILSYIPRQRRTGLFSATQTKELQDLIRAGLRNPVLVAVKEKSTLSTPVLLQNQYMVVESDQKFVMLLNFLKNYCQNGKTLIFFSTCACVEYWSKILPHFLDTKIMALHGKMKNKRNKIMEKFRKEENIILLTTDVLARGLDVAEICWVIQFDPPSNAASFVHRVGRTARQGTIGNALIMLLPSEDAYVTFLKINQKVSLNLLETESIDVNVKEVNKIIHKIQIEDRDVYDKAMRAFVSYVRAYSKHECSALLKVKDLNLGKIATSYGLISLPKMPEIKSTNSADFQSPELHVDFDKITYKNPQKEKVRKEKLKTYAQTGEWPGVKKGKKKTEPWNLTKQDKALAKQKKLERKAKKKLKSDTQVENKKSKKRKLPYTEEDLRALAEDIKLLKQVKKKKITEEDYDKSIGLDTNN